MDAPRQILRLSVFISISAAVAANAHAASVRTENFIVSAPTPAQAQRIAQEAERFRRELAVEWLEKELPRWPQPCPIQADVDPRKGAGGATSFAFHNGQPMGWEMSVQGSFERILDSVLPHEVTHTIFATHFGQPLPRWADEGACTTVEHFSERKKQEDWLIQFIRERRGIPFNRMFAMTEYPRDILPLYAQGYSVARYLIAQGGKPKFVRFVGDGLKTNDWNGAVRKHYQYNRLGDLQLAWQDWLKRGQNIDDVRRDPNIMLASATSASGKSNAFSDRNGERPTRPLGEKPVIQRDDRSADQPNAGRHLAAAGNGGWYARQIKGETIARSVPSASNRKENTSKASATPRRADRSSRDGGWTSLSIRDADRGRIRR